MLPTLIELDSLDELGREVFGPVLHLVRYPRTRLGELLEQINGSGYGLTLGVHTRIDETIAQVVNVAKVGNLYVNRNIVGAVVGVQPFGGEGLSGTGPKAGGPLYMYRLLGPVPRRRWPTSCTRSPVPCMPRRKPPRGPARLGEQAGSGPRRPVRSLRRALPERPYPAADRPHRRAQQLQPAAPGTGALSCPGEGRPAGPAGRLSGGRQPGAAAGRCPDTLPALFPADRGAGSHRAGGGLGHGETDFDALLHHGDSDQLREVSKLAAARQAARNGAIIGVHGLHRGETDIPLERLLIEHALSVNTAAAGGNASLMTIG